MVELLPCQSYEARYVPDHAVVGFAFDMQRGEHAFASDRSRPFFARPNGLAYVPAGCPVYSRSSQGGEYLRIEWRGPFEVADPHPYSDCLDTPSLYAARALRRLLLAAGAVDPIEVEGLVHVLVGGAGARLGEPRLPQAARWMTPRRLRHTLEWIEAELHRPFAVVELARAVGLSARFFSGAFRAAVGQAPHDFVIERRVARARALLHAGEQSLVEVALACGFASHAHLTSTFRRRLGVPPSALRT